MPGNRRVGVVYLPLAVSIVCVASFLCSLLYLLACLHLVGLFGAAATAEHWIVVMCRIGGGAAFICPA